MFINMKNVGQQGMLWFQFWTCEPCLVTGHCQLQLKSYQLSVSYTMFDRVKLMNFFLQL